MRALKSKVLHAAVFLQLAFFPVVAMTDPISLYVMVGAISFVSSVSVVHAYWPALRHSVSRSISDLDKADILSMAIILAFFSIAARELYSTFYVGLVRTEDTASVSDDYFLPLAFFRYTAVVAALMALSSRNDVIGPPIMRRVPGWPRALVSLGIGVIVGIILLKLRAS